MITCILENGRKTSFRHVALHAIVEKLSGTKATVAYDFLKITLQFYFVK